MTDGTTSQDFLLTLACPQRPGIVHAISGFLLDHSLAAEDLAAIGRDAECLALAHAVQWHIERRVLRNGSRTVVFR